MTLNRLRCSGLVKGEETKGSAIFFSETFLARYCLTILRFRRADFTFVDVVWRLGTREGWKLIVKFRLERRY